MSTFFHIWKTPLLLGVLTLFGLLAALLGTGLWHWASWIALTIPVVIGLWYSLRRQAARK